MRENRELSYNEIGCRGIELRDWLRKKKLSIPPPEDCALMDSIVADSIHREITFSTQGLRALYTYFYWVGFYRGYETRNLETMWGKGG